MPAMSAPSIYDLDIAILWSAGVIEFVGGLFVAAACLRAAAILLSTLGTRHGVVSARLT